MVYTVYTVYGVDYEGAPILKRGPPFPYEMYLVSSHHSFPDLTRVMSFNGILPHVLVGVEWCHIFIYFIALSFFE